jgi:hypothetical protein
VADARHERFRVGWLDVASDRFGLAAPGATADMRMLRGLLAYPADQDGTGVPFTRERVGQRGAVPVVLIIHGRASGFLNARFDHPRECTLPPDPVPSSLCTRSSADDGQPRRSPGDPADLRWQRQRLYKGFDYFQRTLARAGIVSFAVDIGGIPDSRGGPYKPLALSTAHNAVRYLFAAHRDPSHELSGRLDLMRFGIMGHSRGGGFAIDLAHALSARGGDRSPSIPAGVGRIEGIDVGAVMVLAPHPQFLEYPQRGDPYSFMAIVPSADEQPLALTMERAGIRFYDRKEATPVVYPPSQDTSAPGNRP